MLVSRGGIYPATTAITPRPPTMYRIRRVDVWLRGERYTVVPPSDCNASLVYISVDTRWKRQVIAFGACTAAVSMPGLQLANHVARTCWGRFCDRFRLKSTKALASNSISCVRSGQNTWLAVSCWLRVLCFSGAKIVPRTCNCAPFNKHVQGGSKEVKILRGALKSWYIYAPQSRTIWIKWVFKRLTLR